MTAYPFSTGNIHQLAAQMASLQEEMQAAQKQLLKGAFYETFDAFPQLEAITWTQYTPYFNDGEPCEFGMNQAYLLTKEEYAKVKNGEYAEEAVDGYREWNIRGDNHVSHKLAMKERGYDWAKDPDWRDEAADFLGSMLKTVHEDQFKSTYGDHTSVTYVRGQDDPIIDEYSHE